MINKKPRIGITLRIENIEDYNEKRDAISQEWTNFIEESNGIPIFIPNTLKNTKLFLQELELEGLILSGGDNKGDDEHRDKTEHDLIDFGIKNKIPILGVCRGMQVINNYFGGSHITTKNNEHVGKHHDVTIIDKKMGERLELKKMKVNSFHHNIILKKNLGKDLKIFAKSVNDDTIEGFIHQQLSIIGVMWHPERENNLEKKFKLSNMFHERKNG
jgi:putative glutamine amidotransferase